MGFLEVGPSASWPRPRRLQCANQTRLPSFLTSMGTSGLNHARASHTISNLILQAMYARSLHKFEHLLSPPRPSPQTVGKCGPKLGGQCSCLTAVFGLRFVDGISICLRNTHREGTDICTTEEIDSLTGSACVCGIMHREETDVICVSPWIG